MALKKYSKKQGQYLSFIFYYQRLNGYSPAEMDFQKYFKVSPPTVHDMIIRLENLGYIKRIPGKARSIELLIDRDKLPDLE